MITNTAEWFLRDAENAIAAGSVNQAHIAGVEVVALRAEVESLRAENTRLRVKNKFLREKAGYFRDDIEDGAAGRDGSTGVFASPGSGSTPEAPSLGTLAGRGPEARGKAIRRDRCLACLTQGRYGEHVCEEPDAPPSPDARGDDDEPEVVVERGPRTRLSMERLRGLLEAVDAVLKGVSSRRLDALAAKRKEWP